MSESFSDTTSRTRNNSRLSRGGSDPKVSDSDSQPPLAVKRLNGAVSHDCYCWICHQEYQPLFACTTCFRVYHKRCVTVAYTPENWICMECSAIMTAESCAKGKNLPIRSDQLHRVLKLCLGRIKSLSNEAFFQPVDENVVSNYSDFVLNPMDLSIIEEKVKRREYGCTKSFTSDLKLILHNCTIFNGPGSPLTVSAKSLVRTCKADISDIDTCADCYEHSIDRSDPNWFAEPCHQPHQIVWAKLKGYPFWPAKVIKDLNGNLNVRFFGAHDRAWIPSCNAFLFSKERPQQTNSRQILKDGVNASMLEVESYIAKYRVMFGKFKYFPVNTPYDPDNVFCPDKPIKRKLKASEVNRRSSLNQDKIGNGKEKVNKNSSAVEFLKPLKEGPATKKPRLGIIADLKDKMEKSLLSLKGTAADEDREGEPSGRNSSLEEASESSGRSRQNSESNDDFSASPHDGHQSRDRSPEDKDSDSVGELVIASEDCTQDDDGTEGKAPITNSTKLESQCNIGSSKVLEQKNEFTDVIPPTEEVADGILATHDGEMAETTETLPNLDKRMDDMKVRHDVKNGDKEAAEVLRAISGEGMTIGDKDEESMFVISEVSSLNDQQPVPLENRTFNLKQVLEANAVRSGKVKVSESLQPAAMSSAVLVSGGVPVISNLKTVKATSLIGPVNQPVLQSLVKKSSAPICTSVVKPVSSSIVIDLDADDEMEKPMHDVQKYFDELKPAFQKVFDSVWQDVRKEKQRVAELTAQVKKLEAEDMKCKQEKAFLSHQIQRSVKEREQALVTEHRLMISNLQVKHNVEKRQIRREAEEKVKNAKKKQWCANCMNEAMFYCCWNTSYCNHTCQKKHWPEHVGICTHSQLGEEEKSSRQAKPLLLNNQQVPLSAPTQYVLVPQGNVTTSYRQSQF